jgi:hypothetical protein
MRPVAIEQGPQVSALNGPQPLHYLLFDLEHDAEPEVLALSTPYKYFSPGVGGLSAPIFALGRIKDDTTLRIELERGMTLPANCAFASLMATGQFLGSEQMDIAMACREEKVMYFIDFAAKNPYFPTFVWKPWASLPLNVINVTSDRGTGFDLGWAMTSLVR